MYSLIRLASFVFGLVRMGVCACGCGRVCVCVCVCEVCVCVGSDVCLFGRLVGLVWLVGWFVCLCVCVLYVGFGSTCSLFGSRPADSLDHRFGFFLCFPFSVLRVPPSLMRQQISVSSPDVKLT